MDQNVSLHMFYCWKEELSSTFMDSPLQIWIKVEAKIWLNLRPFSSDLMQHHSLFLFHVPVWFCSFFTQDKPNYRRENLAFYRCILKSVQRYLYISLGWRFYKVNKLEEYSGFFLSLTVNKCAWKGYLDSEEKIVQMREI